MAGSFVISISLILLTAREGCPQAYLRPQESDFVQTALDAQLVKIGVVIRQSQESVFLEQAVQFTVEDVNSLKLGLLFRVSFIRVDSDADVIELADLTCRTVESGTKILFLPEDNSVLTSTLHAACDRLDLICFDSLHKAFGSSSSSTFFTIQPDGTVLAKATVDLMHNQGMNRTAVIVDGPEDVALLDQVISLGRQRNITVRVFYRDHGPSYRPVLRQLRSEGLSTFLVAVDPSNYPIFIRNMAELNMHDDHYTYLFMGLNMWLRDLIDVSFLGVHLMAFSPLDLTKHENPSKMSEMLAFAEARGITTEGFHKRINTIPTQAAYLYDSLHVLARALQVFLPFPQEFDQPVSCTTTSGSSFGTTVLNYLNTVSFHGLTGMIRMSPAGREEHSLHLLNLTQAGLEDIGVWSTRGGLTLTKMDPEQTTPVSTAKTTDGTEDDPLIVVSLLQEPFLMIRDDVKKALAAKNQTLSNADVTEEHVHGFVIDLLEAINKNLRSRGDKGFTYKLYIVPDNQFGIQDSTGKWSGMVAEILNGKADLAVAAFTLTAQREAVISFTKPFMTAGIGILYQAPRGSAQNLFALMRSLSAELWLASLTATALVAICMWIVARFTPLEWSNRHICTGIETKFAVNIFNLRNSFWFAMCSLMMQGCDVNPRAISTRIIGGIWWFYTLFLSNHFIAKLASVLTVEKMSVPFTTVDELVQHTEIKYGLLSHGSTYEFFRDSKIPIYHDMFARVNASFPPVTTQSSLEGIQRVMSEKYAYLMESTEIEYLVERNCNVTQIGGTLNTIQYGIGTPNDSPWTEKISMAILYLVESSDIAEMQQEWWKRGSVCAKEEKSTGPSAINSTLVGGAFLILIVGLILAVLAAVIEFVWNALHNARIDKTALWKELILELRYALRFGASATRPVLQKFCRTCGARTHSLAAAQMHEHKDYTPMLFLDATVDPRNR